jgi:hypothetical protein
MSLGNQLSTSRDYLREDACAPAATLLNGVMTRSASAGALKLAARRSAETG